MEIEARNGCPQVPLRARDDDVLGRNTMATRRRTPQGDMVVTNVGVVV